MVADCFEKIRVNPGNFVDGRKRFDEKVYDDDSQFRQEQEHIREVPLHRQFVVSHAYEPIIYIYIYTHIYILSILNIHFAECHHKWGLQ